MALTHPVVVVILFVLAAWLILRFLLATLATIGWCLSCESGSLLVPCFGTRGKRFRRTEEVRQIIGHVRLATKLNLPLKKALCVAALSERRGVSRKLKALAYAIGTGTPLWKAFELRVTPCPSVIVEMLKKGERHGQLANALAEADRRLTDRLDRGPDRGNYALTYALLMSLVVFTVVGYVMIFVVPKFREIFLDFDIELPGITVLLMQIMDSLVFPLVGGLFALGFFWLVIMGIQVAGASPFMRLATPIGMLRWSIPVLRRIDFGLGMATAIRSFSLVLRSGQPLDRAVGAVETVGPTNRLRVRLADFIEQVEAGVIPHEAAKKARLGRVFVSSLRMIERGEDPEEVLSYAASYYENIGYRWWNLLSSASVPFVTLVLAAVVAFVAFALFMPLVAMIDGVMEDVI